MSRCAHFKQMDSGHDTHRLPKIPTRYAWASLGSTTFWLEFYYTMSNRVCLWYVSRCTGSDKYLSPEYEIWNTYMKTITRPLWIGANDQITPDSIVWSRCAIWAPHLLTISVAFLFDKDAALVSLCVTGHNSRWLTPPWSIPWATSIVSSSRPHWLSASRGRPTSRS